MDERDVAEVRFGEELLKSRLLTDAQLKTVLEYRDSLGGRVQDVVLKLGFVEEDDLSRFLARREHMPSIDLERMPLDRDLMARIPRKVIVEHQALPFRLADDLILLVTSEPYDLQVVEDVQFITNCRVEIGLAPRSLLQEKINRYYAAQDREQLEVVERAEQPEPASAPPERSVSSNPRSAEDPLRAMFDRMPDAEPASDAQEAGVEEQDLAERLVASIEDPAVAALAKALLDRGVLSAGEWARHLE